MTTSLSIIIPYFNERDYIAATLESLGNQQSRDFCLILVDNASTDGSAAIARAVMARFPDIKCQFLFNPVPGQLPTLEVGLARVATPFVASCDADTIYPPHYVETCLKLFTSVPSDVPEEPVVGVMAISLYETPDQPQSRQRIRKVLLKSRLFRSQCHTGGYAQAYRTAALRAAGGFQNARWPYVLYDHEVYERVRSFGAIRYDRSHYCFPSSRRVDRRSVSWTWGERMVYRFMPSKRKGWFFYSFLAQRFAQRGLVQVKLRERSF